MIDQIAYQMAHNAPFVMVVLCALVAFSKSARATGVILFLAFSINSYYSEYFTDLANAVINGYPNYASTVGAIVMNVIASIFLLISYLKFKEDQVIPQALILWAFIWADLILLASISIILPEVRNGIEPTGFSYAYYLNYEYVIVSLYLVTIWTLGRNIKDGFRSVSSLFLDLRSNILIPSGRSMFNWLFYIYKQGMGKIQTKNVGKLQSHKDTNKYISG